MYSIYKKTLKCKKQILSGSRQLRLRLLHRLLLWQRNDKYRPFIHLTARRDEAIVLLHDLLAQGQPDTRSFEFAVQMQPLEHPEYLLRIFLLKADSIVLNENATLSFGKLIVRHVFNVI